ncbi:hypothetical protein QAD02_023466 [Eretmocerus hayati]|uniref:Uncharacterized protein n=1 Tax=Eretmocerus hayati TaxID=131215 RepID=A0ACC2PZ93_9HYME|nr:hypothetical protein QAD02_023466 [Eretmocerus hayati]
METADVFESYYCKGPIFFLKLMGLWPSESLLRRRSKFAIYMILSVSFALPQLLFIIRKSAGNLDVVAENVGVIIMILLGIIHYTSAYVNRERLDALYFEAVEEWRNITDKKERKILAGFIWTAWLVGIIYTGYMVANGLIVVPALPIICTLLDHYHPMENGTQYRVVPTNNDYFFFEQEDHYWFAWMHAVVGVNSVCFVFSGLNTMYIMFIREICGLFSIVRYILNRMFLRIFSFRLTKHVTSRTNSSNNLPDISNESTHVMSQNNTVFDNLQGDTMNKSIRDELKQAVSLHVKVTRFCELLEDTFNLMIMLVQLLNIFLVSITYYYVSNFWKVPSSWGAVVVAVHLDATSIVNPVAVHPAAVVVSAARIQVFLDEELQIEFQGEFKLEGLRENFPVLELGEGIPILIGAPAAAQNIQPSDDRPATAHQPIDDDLLEMFLDAELQKEFSEEFIVASCLQNEHSAVPELIPPLSSSESKAPPAKRSRH